MMTTDYYSACLQMPRLIYSFDSLNVIFIIGYNMLKK